MVREPTSYTEFSADAWYHNRLKPFLEMDGRRSILSNFSYEGTMSGPCRNPTVMTMKGSWLYFSHRDKRRPKQDWEDVYHGTSLYLLRRIAARGFEVGWSSLSSATRPAVYSHPQRDMHRCFSYTTYCHIFGDGVYVCVLFYLSTAMHIDDLKVVHNRGGGVKQICVYPGHHVVHGFYLHILHQDDIREDGHGTVISSPWQGELELATEGTSEDWWRRSKDRYLRRSRAN